MLSMLSVENLMWGILFLGPYIAFIFFGESFDPISKPKIYALRSNWRFGRAMALAVFVGSMCAVILMKIGELPLPTSMFYGAIVSVVLGTMFSAKRLVGIFKP